MNDLTRELHHDPIPPLLGSGNEALIFFTRRDLLDETDLDTSTLWELPEPLSILRRQQANGSWKYPGRHADYRDNAGYDQLETFRQLGYLVEKYGFDRRHSAIRKTADYLFTCQTAAGDFRGIYGTQYTTTYSPMIGELLIKAGYTDDARVSRSLDWLLDMRQTDGGWAIPLRTVGAKYTDVVHDPHVIEPNRSKPFSHLITGCALRALATHPDYRHRPEVRQAGGLLASRFFKRDKYPDRSDISYWTAFSYPYWFTDILASLDSLSKIGLSEESDPKIAKALDWLRKHQSTDGTWRDLNLLRGRDKQQYLWISLQILRVRVAFDHLAGRP